ncbi:MAG: hypothetical protein WCK82_07040, partial [Bacteroidota bacterium]
MNFKKQYILVLISIVMILMGANLLRAQNKSADTSQLNKLQHLSELVVTGQYGESSLTKSIYKV